MKNRNNKIKRLHAIIDGLERYLVDNVASKIYVDGIIPGRIKPSKGNYPALLLEFKYITKSGVKCLCKSGRAVQEVFIISTNNKKLLEEVFKIKIAEDEKN